VGWGRLLGFFSADKLKAMMIGLNNNICLIVYFVFLILVVPYVQI